jgi:hypothetical protein
MITKDGYATVPWGKRFVLIYNGFQLSDHKTEEAAIEALKKHQKKTQGASKKTGTRSKSKAKLVLE